MTFFQCTKCKKTFEWNAEDLPETCPNCNQKCTFKDVTNYTTDNAGPGNIDPRLLEK